MRSLQVKNGRLLVLLVLAGTFAGCALTPESEVSLPAAHHITELAILENPQALVFSIQADSLPAYQVTWQTAPAGLLISLADTGLQIVPKIYRPPDNDVIDWIEAREIAVSGVPAVRLFVVLKKKQPYGLALDPDGIRIIFARESAPAAGMPSTVGK